MDCVCMLKLSTWLSSYRIKLYRFFKKLWHKTSRVKHISVKICPETFRLLTLTEKK